MSFFGLVKFGLESSRTHKAALCSWAVNPTWTSRCCTLGCLHFRPQRAYQAEEQWRFVSPVCVCTVNCADMQAERAQIKNKNNFASGSSDRHGDLLPILHVAPFLIYIQHHDCRKSSWKVLYVVCILVYNCCVTTRGCLVIKQTSLMHIHHHALPQTPLCTLLACPLTWIHRLLPSPGFNIR